MIPNNFVKIGEYIELNKAPDYEPFIGRSKSKILPIVYLLVCKGEVMYVGETRRGYSRPLSYHKNTVMKTQKEAIEHELGIGNVVEVFCIHVPNQIVTFNSESFENYIAQDYEKALIKRLNPPWNGRS
jgi:hypothetical protein